MIIIIIKLPDTAGMCRMTMALAMPFTEPITAVPESRELVLWSGPGHSRGGRCVAANCCLDLGVSGSGKVACLGLDQSQELVAIVDQLGGQRLALSCSQDTQSPQ